MTTMKKNVLIADGQTMLTDFLVPYLEQEFPDFVFSKASCIKQAQEKILQQVFEVVIADLLGMETSGIFLIHELHRKSPGTACVVLSNELHSFWVNRALNNGALGFVSKSAPRTELVHALKAALQGRRYLSPDAAHCLVKSLSIRPGGCPLDWLSTRELEVFIQIGQGKAFKVISEELQMSVKTVAVHKFNIAKKTGIDSSAKIARYCAEQGLLATAATRKTLTLSAMKHAGSARSLAAELSRAG